MKANLTELRNSVEIGDLYIARRTNNYIIIIEKHDHYVNVFSLRYKQLEIRSYVNIEKYWIKVT